MFSINTNELEQQSRLLNSKINLARNNPVVFDSLKLCFVNYIDIVTKWPVYNTSHWINNVDRWRNNLNYTNYRKFKRGDIVYVDLGAQNFGHEPSYSHICVVLKNNFDSILVVPCSTKQFGKGRPGVIDATTADGFLRDTGIQTECFRWISKNRVISHTRNKVTNAILEQIDKALLSLAPSIVLKIQNKDQIIASQQQQILNLQEQIVKLSKNNNEDMDK